MVFFAGQFKSKDQTALLGAICSLWGGWKASISEDTEGYPIGIYMFKVNNRNTRTRCEICSKLAMFKVMFLMISFYHIKTFCEVYSMFSLQSSFYKKTTNAQILRMEIFPHYFSHFVILQSSNILTIEGVNCDT